MKNFERDDLEFSLCPMKLDGYCPGCGGGAGNQSCAIARCGMEHGNCRYCFECAAYPCGKYDGAEEYDSFITHRRQLSDMEKAKTIGLPAYRTELEEKAAALKFLLENCNDGRRKTFFCLAVNLLEISDVRAILGEMESAVSDETALKTRAAMAVERFQDAAQRQGVVLKLNKAPPKAKEAK